jgi:hypothetical protein
MRPDSVKVTDGEDRCDPLGSDDGRMHKPGPTWHTHRKPMVLNLTG